MSAPSSVDVLCLVLGALRTGVVPVVLDPALLDHERAERVADVEPAAVVRGEAEVADLVGGDAEAELAPVPLARPMHMTSGTSGRPKGVWSGVLDEAEAAALLDDERSVWGFDAADVHLVCSPLHHSAAIRFAAGTLLAGGDVVLLPRFDADVAARTIAEERPTTTFMAPAHLQRLHARAGGLADLSPLRLLAHAGAPCPPPLKRAVMAAARPGAVWEFYGATEGQITVCPPDVWLEAPGTVGRARPGRRVEVDDAGVVWCHAPPFARFSYWRDPDKTAAAWRGDAFTVGDLGRLDGEGRLFLDGRRDDLVITGGVNVYPAEVEQVLLDLPGVVAVAVFGIADERWGQRVAAAVVPHAAGGLRPEDVLDHARQRLAPSKRPKEVHLVDELPVTSTGKLRRLAVAAALGLGEQHEQEPPSAGG